MSNTDQPTPEPASDAAKQAAERLNSMFGQKGYINAEDCLTALAPLLSITSKTRQDLSASLAEWEESLRVLRIAQSTIAAFENETADLKARLEAAEKERDALAEWKRNTEAVLADGHAVHLNMLRGTIATPTKAQLLHVLGDQSLSTAEVDRYRLEKRVADLLAAVDVVRKALVQCHPAQILDNARMSDPRERDAALLKCCEQVTEALVLLAKWKGAS